MPWYRQDAFLHPDNADFNPVQGGNIGGVKPSPATMAKPADNAVRETFSTDENMEERNQSAKGNDTPAPVATDAGMSEDTICCPGRQEDGEVEGEPGLYTPGDGAANLFGPSVAEEAGE